MEVHDPPMALEAVSLSAGPWWVGLLVTLVIALFGGVLGSILTELVKARMQDRREKGQRTRQSGDIVARAVDQYRRALYARNTQDALRELDNLSRESSVCLPDLPQGLAMLIPMVDVTSRAFIHMAQDAAEDAEDNEKGISAVWDALDDMALVLYFQVTGWHLDGRASQIEDAQLRVAKYAGMIVRGGSSEQADPSRDHTEESRVASS